MDERLKRDLFMFLSFVTISVVVYVFHIIQSAGQIRGYATGLSLILAWFILIKERDRRLRHLWGSFLIWVIHSNVYFDVRTHYTGVFRFVKHILFLLLVLYLRLTPRKHDKTTKMSTFRNIAIIMLHFYVALFPDVSTNAYGNALFSILRVFVVTILVMTRYNDEYKNLIDSSNSGTLYDKNKSMVYLELDEFCWVFFIHEYLLFVSVLQLLGDIAPLERKADFPWCQFKINYRESYGFETHSDPRKKHDGVIRMEDVPFLNNNKTNFK
tara:strand:+ start:3270 stop:4076 length:807 start_codon:yes stop_codon:yes gene_type:complete